MPAENDATPVAESRTLKPRTLRNIKYFLSRLVALALSFAIMGAIYQYVASSRDLRTYSPPGVFVEVNGYKMHVYSAGGFDGGGPTVILESGLNDGWLSHVRVYQKMYPNDVAGIVLVDPSHTDEMNRLPSQFMRGRSQRRLKFELLKLAMPFGILPGSLP
jgi:hypothetical protein